MLEGKNWYIINLKLHRERKVVEALKRKKIEIYYPLNKIRKQQKDRNSPLIYESLFLNHAFVNISESEIQVVKQTEGVLHFLYWLNDYAIVSKEDINAIRFFLNIYHDVWLEKTNMNNENDHALKIPGNFNSYDQNMNNNIEKLFLPTLGYFLLAQAETKKEILHHAI